MADTPMRGDRGGRAPVTHAPLEGELRRRRVLGLGPGAGEAWLIDPVSRCLPDKALQGSEYAGGVMTVGSARRGVSFALALSTFCWMFVWSPPAGALEAFDGRIQAHGFFEMQIRGLSEQYGLNGQELGLAQWYNILNLELEFDIIPDGYGPIDLL